MRKITLKVKMLGIPMNKGGGQLYGGIAQLGERLNGIQEVMGSNPTISTKNNKPQA